MAVKKYYNKQDLVQDISHDLHLKPGVVQAVLDSMVGILLEKMVNGVPVMLTNLFTVDTHVVKKVVVPPSTVSLRPQEEQTIENQVRLSLKVSPSLKRLFRLQQDRFPDKPYFVHRHNFGDALNWLKEEEKKGRRPAPRRQAPAPPSGNPFLDDDE